MKIAFIDGARLAYPLDALDSAPLGGTQSAMLALAEALAAGGDEVCVAARAVQDGAAHRGVSGLSLRRVLDDARALPALDAAILVNSDLPLGALPVLSRRIPLLVQWHQNDALSPDSRYLADIAAQGDVAHFVFCSHAQASAFLALRELPGERASVIQSALSPAFCSLFATGEAILPAKDPELLVYTSAPHRGLEGLVRTLFPELRRRRPALRLEIYSGFALQQGARIGRDGADNTGHYEALLAECAGMPGVSCHRGLAKRALAGRLRAAAMLCYPCTFRETASLSTLEAMAAGCLVSTTDAGALPEACAGFAQLTRLRGGEVLVEPFLEKTLGMLEEREREPQKVEARLRRQIERFGALHAPAAVARRWRTLLARLLAQAESGA